MDKKTVNKFILKCCKKFLLENNLYGKLMRNYYFKNYYFSNNNIDYIENTNDKYNFTFYFFIINWFNSIEGDDFWLKNCTKWCDFIVNKLNV